MIQFAGGDLVGQGKRRMVRGVKAQERRIIHVHVHE